MPEAERVGAEVLGVWPRLRCSPGARELGGHGGWIVVVSPGVDGDPVVVLDCRGNVGIGAAGAVATGGDAVVVDPEGKVGVCSFVGGAGDPEAAAADAGAGQRSKVIEDGMRGFGVGRYT